MQNVKTTLVVGVRGESKDDAEYTVLYLGPDRKAGRDIYLDSRSDLDYDFIGMDTLSGFKSRARPKIDAANEEGRRKAMAAKVAEEVFQTAEVAKSAARNAGELQIEAEAENEAAAKRLAELGVELVTDDEGDDYDEEAELAALIAAEEEDEENADA